MIALGVWFVARSDMLLEIPIDVHSLDRYRLLF